MSTAAQLLRSITEAVEDGLPAPSCVYWLDMSVPTVAFGRYRDDAGEAAAAWSAKFDGEPREPKYRPDGVGSNNPEPYTEREWSASIGGVSVQIHATEKGDTRTDADVLTAAAEHIRKHGLAQHDFTDAAGGCCVNGGIQHVVCGDAANVEAGQSAKRVFAEALGLFGAYEDEVVAVEDLIGRWNDEPGRTADQVVLALLEVADQERAAEQHPAVTR